MTYQNYLLGQGTREDRNPLLADSLVLSISSDGDPMLGFFEGLHPHATGGSVPVTNENLERVFDDSKLVRSNAIWMKPLIESWSHGNSFSIEDVFMKYRELHGHDPESTSGRFCEFPSVSTWHQVSE